jgi:hypothetical protein
VRRESELRREVTTEIETERGGGREREGRDGEREDHLCFIIETDYATIMFFPNPAPNPIKLFCSHL